MASLSIPMPFVWRRLHSLTGLWLVLFLIEHLITNSQAAVFLGKHGQGFVRMVNALHNFPYLEAIEIFLLGVPIAIHLAWGWKYLRTAQSHSWKNDGSKPHLNYGRNHAYTLQRITSWILTICLVGHIVKFRFLEYPLSVEKERQNLYLVRISRDSDLEQLTDRLGVLLYNKQAIEKEREQMGKPPSSMQQLQERQTWVNALERRPISEHQVIAVSDQFGTASLLAVRNTFKNPFYVAIYTLFVLAACFHAWNGFWTFLTTWGIILKAAAQKTMVPFSMSLMIIMLFLGLAAIWGTHFL
jgi:succinate dehydrogenase / fumarate reductase, cytochrome b subunit